MASSSVAADMELDRPNLEDYLQSVSLPQEAPHYLHLRDLLDISPVLTQAAGAIVDVSVAEDVEKEAEDVGSRGSCSFF
ncbi:uncharacterized protein LOC8069464 isoform X5 [Sorghum bicolor]|uniref:uncharacterized protein LOC8069464 isoform X5 n=1 Tax=Sorghum bicolor TaxID=4558 RepID=UPI000B425940|nr:uncharacterized protein LOC8069464 isoform X5 [Sorghum bicolor]|eukprot:XP_021318878.1 uncharacterized protein LOC8069464 isoform X5 [Sorghum bicolor]